MKKTLLLILCLLAITGCGCNKQKVINNTNEDIIKNQKLGEFSFTKTSLKYENGTSILTTKVTNTSNEKKFLQEFKINVKDSNGEIIITMVGYIGSSIDANSSKTIISSCGLDLTKAYSIEYEILK